MPNRIEFTIPGQLPGLNEYTKACRGNRYAGASMKNDAEDIVAMAAYKIKGQQITKPAHIIFNWVEPNSRRDTDNIAFAKKFILDALVQIGILQGDSRQFVTGFTDTFGKPDKQNPRIEVTITEVSGENG